MAEQIDMFRTESNVEWIKTSDKLPPMHDWVLVVVEETRVVNADYRSVGIGKLDDLNAQSTQPCKPGWKIAGYGHWVGLSIVTHWAPLPVLPER